MASGKDRLLRAIRQAFELKADKEDLIPGSLGRYNASGTKEIDVSSRPGFVYVRLRGQTSEVIQAFNEIAGLQFDQAILLIKDPYNPRYYRVVGRDTGKFQSWTESQVVPHGDQHSFQDPSNAGRDIVYVYKRQLAQPLLCRPQSTANMTTHVESDFYFWGGQNKYFAGADSPSFSPYLPTASFGRFVVVYLDGGTGTIKLLAGSTFSESFPPSDVISQIPSLDPNIGIPLAAVYLSSTTTSVSWSDMFDIRVMLFTGASSYPATHALDPSGGSHSGCLDATDVCLADPSGSFSSTNVEDALNEVMDDISSWAWFLRR